MRLFVAIGLNGDIKDAVKDLQDRSRDRRMKGNYPPEENLHITLAFIGEYGDPDAVMDALENVSFRPFGIRTAGTGRFGGVWWAGLEGDGLEPLAKKVRRALAEAGIPFDRKRFRAHITFLRQKDGIADGQITAGAISPAEMTVGEFSLMRSDRGRNGMIYTELGVIRARDI